MNSHHVRTTTGQQASGLRSGQRRRFWSLAGAMIMAIGLASATVRAADSPAALEYRVKAGYLFNFAKYVEWPTNSLPETNSPIIIGVMDAAEAMPAIQEVLANKSANGRPIVVKVITTPSPADGCHILFVSRTAKTSPAKVRAALGPVATLIVGETDLFAEQGGMIGFVRDEEAFRLNLNLESVTNTNLKVSSKLASVARLVKTQRTK